MKIKSIKLINYRGAVSLNIDFHRQLNVFIGVNGAGKSTILDSLAIMLSWLVNRLKNTNASGRQISETEINNGQGTAIIEITGVTEDSQEITWKIVKTRTGYIHAGERSNFSQLNEYTQQIQRQITDHQGEINLPLFVYYSVNRAVLDIPLKIKTKHQFDSLSAYENALTSGSDFRTFFEWFREREDLENENRKYREAEIKPEGFCFPDPQLEAVRETIERFLPDFTNLSVRRNPLRMEVTKKDKIVTVNQLSDGEKCLIAMLGDLARRMAIANPQNPDPLKGNGVIIIDEIDLHLHPQWQRFVVPKLLEVFPNCQFFISTHSPNIITHVQPESLHFMEQTEMGIKFHPVQESYGKNVDRILEDLMGLETTRPQEIAEALKDIYEQISHNQLEAAKNKINDLRAKIQDDPELIKAEVIIRRKEIIGK
ncbi:MULTISPECIES: AAA family ATPase [unclassified Microcystis]|uniref:AAA family ATPase n=1 Tax=unclassified Microcystis TaxID=2643300 RepID=UPI001190D4BB|nr:MULTISPECIES: AAA family ATPase [unclassified Microcystis]MCA2928852.1 AAA family ATPase [Microcystis sp. M020S1]MCA2933597.1 AAA family ATPase [Microcystis sp. M015S1]MCA2620868.1 AAA family ATPase [Microcystis sp. M099S2]MCA2650551.1 AAA family ATPase [Microcystis sp. M065S2]MCA2680864.1 AAA family ATPase [Microcystis sp. M043S2]